MESHLANLSLAISRYCFLFSYHPQYGLSGLPYHPSNIEVWANSVVTCQVTLNRPAMSGFDEWFDSSSDQLELGRAFDAQKSYLLKVPIKSQAES